MKPITSRIAVATALSFAFVATPAWAENTPESEEASAKEQSSQTGTARASVRESGPEYSGNIIVAAEGLEELDFIAGQDVLGLDEIQRDLSGQVGELLVKIPGVSATSFAPGASRPILRGLDAERVQVLIDGLGTADVGNTSADHATTIDPLTVQRIEVLRGPTALLFGSQAIGGVVNVIDRRIPVDVPENGIRVDGLTAFDTVANLRSGGLSLDAALGENFVLHVDGSYRETGDLDIPGFQLTREFAADILDLAVEEEAAGELERAEELVEAAEREGFIPNSDTETFTVNGGFGIILGESTIGASVGYYDSNYGIVKNPAFEEEEEEGGEEEEEEGEETIRLDIEQVRVDVRGDFYLGEGFFSRLKIRGAYSDYTHTELEGGSVGTVFDSETFEARAEFLQSSGGIIGAQYRYRDFAAIGAEAFVPPNETSQFSIFTAQEVDLEAFQIEGAARYERVDVESEPLGLERDFDLFSGALSLVVVPAGAEDVRLGLTGSRSERAPAGEELFADGPHIATQTFEIGDPDLNTESAWGLEAFARGEVGDVQFGVSVYGQWFDDFIFLTPNGEIEDGLPVFLFLQQDANFFGFEGQVQFPLYESDDFGLTADLRAEYVSAELEDDTDAPRIPPFSLLGALDANIGDFDLRGEVQYFAEQDEVALFETPTDDFTFVNLYVSWRPLASNRNVVLQLAAENLFDVTGRRHSSFTKEFVPLPGQNFRASARFSF